MAYHRYLDSGPDYELRPRNLILTSNVSMGESLTMLKNTALRAIVLKYSTVSMLSSIYFSAILLFIQLVYAQHCERY